MTLSLNPASLTAANPTTRRLNVLDYGADDTGIASSTAAFHACIAAAIAAGLGVIVPAGSYLFNTALDTTDITPPGGVLNGFDLICEAGVKLVAGSFSGTMITLGATGTSQWLGGIRIELGVVQGRGKAVTPSQNGVLLKNINDGTIHIGVIDSFSGDGLNTDNTNGSIGFFNNRISWDKISSNGGRGVNINGYTNAGNPYGFQGNTLLPGQTIANGSDGLRIGGAATNTNAILNTLLGGVFEHNGGWGILDNSGGWNIMPSNTNSNTSGGYGCPVGVPTPSRVVAALSDGASINQATDLINLATLPGPKTAPTVVAASTDYVVTFDRHMTVYVTGGTGVAVSVGGTATGLAAGTFKVLPGGKINLGAYSVAPSWVWYAE